MQIYLFSLCFCFVSVVIASAQPSFKTNQNTTAPALRRGFFDQKIDQIIKVLDSKNISQHILNQVSLITPPIESTPGINTVTKIFEVLPQDVKDSLVNLFPDTIDFPGTRLWEAAARRWIQLQGKSSAVRDQLERSGVLDQARDAVQRYNQLMEWRSDMPSAVHDERVGAFRNITEPLYDTRTRIIESRDAVLDSFLARQKATWEPVVNKSVEIGNSIQGVRSHLSQVADSRLLGRLTGTVYNLRSLMLRFNTNRIYLGRVAKMCALNPVCCEHPERCVPTELSGQF